MTNYPITRIAHLSDAHILEPPSAWRRRGYGLGVHFVSLGRPLDAHERSRKLTRALRAADRAGAQHFVISGDLTEIGTEEQFEAFAEAIDTTAIDPERITLVPGNHDAYTSPDGWSRALAGPLARFARTSARETGQVVDLGNIAFLPLDVACHQAVTRSAGELTNPVADALERRLADPGLAKKPVVIVQHHPPYGRAPAVQWIDGLRGWSRLMAVLERFSDTHVLHGHLHRAVSAVVKFGRDRIFGAPAVVEDVDCPRVRLYDVRGGVLESAGLVSS
jgi:Icc protein